jgi:hypothetical protein
VLPGTAATSGPGGLNSPRLLAQSSPRKPIAGQLRLGIASYGHFVLARAIMS